jgi:hypothetical protein
MKTTTLIILTCLILTLSGSSCKKETTSQCETWIVMYWQGKNDHTTVTANYFPYSRDVNLCGDDKKQASSNKTTIVRQVGADLFDYMTYQGKR